MSERKWAHLHCHDYLSLLDGLSTPLQNIERCVDVGIPACAITNHGNISSAVLFFKAKKKYIDDLKGDIKHSKSEQEKEVLTQKVEDAKKLKLILGSELYIADEEKKNSHLVVLAKNKQGYQQLVKAVSEASRKEYFYRKPRLPLDKLADFTKGGNLISFNGHPGSSLNNTIWLDLDAAFKATTYAEAKALVHPDVKKRLLDLAGKHLEVFGKGNFFIEIQIIDQDRLPMETVASVALRWVAKQLNIPCVATADSHYPTKDRSIDQRVLLCNLLRTTLPKVNKALADDQDDVGLAGFFQSDKYYIPTPKEISEIHTEEEVKNSLLIADMCEEYDLFSKPCVPQFPCPDGISSEEYMKHLCRQGWQDKLSLLRGEEKKVYAERVREELAVLQGAGLSDYFLIVNDIIQWITNQGGLCGEGRGSAAGCMVSYLMGITALDPIQYRLSFARFYNAGRNTKDNISYPDIDCDVPANFKDKTLQYIKNKYGQSKVGKISTYTRLMGRAVLKDVLRAHEACSFDEMNRICSFLMDESAITDDLNEMQEEEGDSSIIKWGLRNNAKELSEWCYLDKQDKLQGPFAGYFAQAMRLEGTYRTRSEHAGGVVIMPDNIEETMPVMYDKNDECVILYDMGSVEYCGGLKMDILATRVLDFLADAQHSIQKEFFKDI